MFLQKSFNIMEKHVEKWLTRRKKHIGGNSGNNYRCKECNKYHLENQGFLGD